MRDRARSAYARAFAVVLGRAESLRAHLENSIAVTSEFFTIKRLRAHGGCLGAKSRRRTWAAAISPGEVLTNL